MEAPGVAHTQQLPLTDLLGRDQKIQIFNSLISEVDSVIQRLADESQYSIVLAPENSALTKLSRKPWENSDDYKSLGPEAYGGEDGQSRANANLQRFVEEHIVPTKSWNEGQKFQTLSGKTVWLEKKGDDLLVSCIIAHNVTKS
jgi:hypothetical protein